MKSKLRPHVAMNLNTSPLITLSAVSKNYRALLRFCVEELGMELWSARVFKRL